MKSNVETFALILVSLLFVTGSAPWLNAQITNAIRAHIDHSFMIGDKTLPPGEYTFRIMDNSDLSIVTATNENGKTQALVSEGPLLIGGLAIPTSFFGSTESGAQT